ncbi:methyltransferase domain-containing protein [Flavihumibacter sp. R14]|nr:methyltransferase domain-containing protein [Flavihumibacter soli]
MNSYDDEYNCSNTLFWDNLPAKFVKLFVEKNLLNLKGCKVLDLGAGEGKNTIYLAKHGAKVDAVDISQEALRRLTLLPEYEVYKSQIDLYNIDALDFNSDQSYDLIVCYGLIHALDNKREALCIINKLKKLANEAGYIIIATFNNLLPPPSVQPYLKVDAFLDSDELKRLFNDWTILEYEESIITETHSTSNIEHQHSISRLIAKKNV